MRKIREVLRLKYDCGCSNREIGLSCGISGSTICEYIQRARSSGVVWPLPADLTVAALERLLLPPPSQQSTERGQSEDSAEYGK